MNDTNNNLVFEFGETVEVTNVSHKWITCKFVTYHPKGGVIVDRDGRPGFEQLEHWQFCRKA